jgi:2-phospho-L-lactate transferase/gluconeogenesis factor (CofD/UPF0052 family)
MKVLILSGGTGSKQLQKGLYDFFGENLDLKLLINCYDNGGTTGTVRQIFDGKILGPSDLKKNQFYRHQLKYGDTKLLEFLELRITSNTPENDILKLLMNYKFKGNFSENAALVFEEAISHFFSMPMSKVIDYEDFSISSLIYAGLAGLNNNSTSMVGTIMSKVLEIDDFIIINDDESLYLNAKSINDQIIDDEGDLVKWDNSNNYIKEIWLENVRGEKQLPILSEKSRKEILEADMIIFSSGTQWSSLIPTYMSIGFKETIKASKAKKYLVMNGNEDKDMTGRGAKELMEILPEYLPFDDITTIFSEEAVDSMKYYPEFKYPFLIGDIYLTSHRIHDRIRLIKLIFNDYYKDYLNSQVHYVFDWDGTVRARELEFNQITQQNIYLLQLLENFSIITGNDINVVDKKIQNLPIHIFADGGNNLYLNDKFIKNISEDYSIKNSNEIFEILNSLHINRSKIHNRNNCTISIKPIDAEYRPSLCMLINEHLPKNLIARITGKTTIDITNINFNKNVPMDFLIEKEDIKNIVYLGDEYNENGNDHPLYIRDDIKFLKIKSVKETAVFLTTLLWRKNYVI